MNTTISPMANLLPTERETIAHHCARTFDETTVSNARGYLERLEGELAEARDNGFSELAAHLEPRVIEAQRQLEAHLAAMPDLENAEHEYKTAVVALHAAHAKVEAGSIDPKEALRLRDARDVARAAERYWAGQLPTLQTLAAAPISRLTGAANKDNRHRDNAERATTGLVFALLKRGRDDAAHAARDRIDQVDAEEVRWWPFFQRRAEAIFKTEHAKQDKYAAGRFVTVDDLKAVYSNRRRHYDARLERARASVRQLEGAR